LNPKRPATLAAVVTAVTLIPLALFGGVGFAKTLASASQYEYGPSGHQYGGKVTICHHAGKHGKRVTITVSANALKGHKKHHDELGPCPSQSTTQATTTTSKHGDDDDRDDNGTHGKSGDHGNNGNGNGKGKGHGK
jgi:hypothetical protein